MGFEIQVARQVRDTDDDSGDSDDEELERQSFGSGGGGWDYVIACMFWAVMRRLLQPPATPSAHGRLARGRWRAVRRAPRVVGATSVVRPEGSHPRGAASAGPASAAPESSGDGAVGAGAGGATDGSPVGGDTTGAATGAAVRRKRVRGDQVTEAVKRRKASDGVAHQVKSILLAAIETPIPQTIDSYATIRSALAVSVHRLTSAIRHTYNGDEHDTHVRWADAPKEFERAAKHDTCEQYVARLRIVQFIIQQTELLPVNWGGYNWGGYIREEEYGFTRNFANADDIRRYFVIMGLGNAGRVLTTDVQELWRPADGSGTVDAASVRRVASFLAEFQGEYLDVCHHWGAHDKMFSVFLSAVDLNRGIELG